MLDKDNLLEIFIGIENDILIHVCAFITLRIIEPFDKNLKKQIDKFSLGLDFWGSVNVIQRAEYQMEH